MSLACNARFRAFTGHDCPCPSNAFGGTQCRGEAWSYPSQSGSGSFDATLFSPGGCSVRCVGSAGNLPAAAKDPHPARWTLALAFGLRQGEVLGLQWRDVDLDAGTLAVRRSLAVRIWQHGCDGTCGRKRGAECPSRHSGGLVAAEPKTPSALRTLTLPLPLVDQLRAEHERQSAQRLALGDLWEPGPGDGWVFPAPTGGPIHPARDWRSWKELLTAAGVRDARLHDARHTSATTMLVLGLDARTVMGLLGWSQVSLTTRYQHVVPELRAEASRRIGDHLWG